MLNEASVLESVRQINTQHSTFNIHYIAIESVRQLNIQHSTLNTQKSLLQRDAFLLGIVEHDGIGNIEEIFLHTVAFLRAWYQLIELGSLLLAEIRDEFHAVDIAAT